MVPEHHSLSQPFYGQGPDDSSSPWLPAQHAKAAPKTKGKSVGCTGTLVFFFFHM